MALRKTSPATQEAAAPEAGQQAPPGDRVMLRLHKKARRESPRGDSFIRVRQAGGDLGPRRFSVLLSPRLCPQPLWRDGGRKVPGHCSRKLNWPGGHDRWAAGSYKQDGDSSARKRVVRVSGFWPASARFRTPGATARCPCSCQLHQSAWPHRESRRPLRG